MALDGPAVAMSVTGGVLLWSGLKGQTVPQTLHAVLSGSPAALSAEGSAATAAETAASSSGSGTAAASDTSAHSPSAAANQATARALAIAMGHPGWVAGQEWADWVSLWNQESGWSSTALNASSGATGIPQLNPSSWPVPGGWSNPVVQITWGISYIAKTYGSPSKAWAHEVAQGWY